MPREVKAYRCNFCTKLYNYQKSAKRHEKFCSKNPKNKHKCFNCSHLMRVNDVQPKEFRCLVSGELMYSYIAEKLNLEIVGEFKRMPLECAFFDEINEVYSQDAGDSIYF